MASRLGVIAEDATDAAVIKVLARHIAGWPVPVHARHDNGCGAMDRKGAVWLEELVDRGATHVIILRDLDRNPENGNLNDEAALRGAWLQKVDALRVPRLICIPVEEL